MTTNELIKEVNDKFGLHQTWPKEYEVNMETYVNVIHSIFERASRYGCLAGHNTLIEIHIGPNKRIMFKGMELKIK